LGNPLFVGIGPSAIKEGTEYWIYYDDGKSIYRRASMDGITFGPPILILANGIYNDVVKVGSTFRMVYNSIDQQQIRLAISIDGVNFIDSGELVSVGSSGEWDDNLLADPSEIKVGSTYYLFYGGENTATGEFAIGLATSVTGRSGSYQKHGTVITKSVSGFQSVGVFDADVFEYDIGKYMMFYTGFDRASQRATYATSTDLLHWTISGVELYWISQAWEQDATYGPNEPSVLIEGGTYKVWYRGNAGGILPDHIGFLTIMQHPITKEPEPGTSKH